LNEQGEPKIGQYSSTYRNQRVKRKNNKNLLCRIAQTVAIHFLKIFNKNFQQNILTKRKQLAKSPSAIESYSELNFVLLILVPPLGRF
jgi:hypothetical protein